MAEFLGFRKVQRMSVQVDKQAVGVAVFVGGSSEGEMSKGEEVEQLEHRALDESG